MPSRPELITWACNTNLRSVKIWRSLDAPRTPWDRHAAPVTALKIRSPSAASKWTFWLPHRGFASISQSLLRLLVSSKAAKETYGHLFRTSRVFPLPHAKDIASAVMSTAAAGNKSRWPVTRGPTNAPCFAVGNPSATPNTYAYCST